MEGKMVDVPTELHSSERPWVETPVGRMRISVLVKGVVWLNTGDGDPLMWNGRAVQGQAHFAVSEGLDLTPPALGDQIGSFFDEETLAGLPVEDCAALHGIVGESLGRVLKETPALVALLRAEEAKDALDAAEGAMTTLKKRLDELVVQRARARRALEEWGSRHRELVAGRTNGIGGA